MKQRELCPRCGRDPFPYRACPDPKDYKGIIEELLRLVDPEVVVRMLNGHCLLDGPQIEDAPGWDS